MLFERRLRGGGAARKLPAMQTIKTTFFDAKPYDREMFEAVNREYGIELKYFDDHLNADTVPMAAGADAICISIELSRQRPCCASTIRAQWTQSIQTRKCSRMFPNCW